MLANLRVAIASVLIVLLGVAPAAAHQFEHPKVLRLGVKQDRVLLSVTYDVNPGPDARLLRSVFDRNADGALDAAEQAKIVKYLEETALLWTRLRIGGAEVKLERLELAPTNVDRPRESADTLGIAAVYTAPLAAGAVELELRDRDKDRTRHVPLEIDLAPGWVVAFSSQGELDPQLRRIRRVMLGEGAPLVLRLRRGP